MAETRRDWEVVQENTNDRTERLKVPGGFLYRIVTSAGAVHVVFVPGSDK